MRPGRGITFNLMLVFTLFAAILLVGGGTIAYLAGRAEILDNFTNELDIASTEKQAALEAWVTNRELDVSAKARSPAMINAVETMLAANSGSLEALNAQDSVVKELRTRVGPGQPFLRWLILRPSNGLVIADTDGGEQGKFREDQPYFIQGKQGTFVQNVYFSLALQAPAMTVSAPLISSNGQLIAVLAAHLDLTELNAIIQLRTGRRETDDAFLVNTSHLFVTQPRLTSDPFVLSKGIHSLASNFCLSGKTGILLTDDYRGVPALIDYAWLPMRNMCLIVKLDQAEVFAPVNAMRDSILLITLLALLIASALAYWLARTITVPVRQLIDGVREIGSGNLNARIDVKNTDEIGLLAQAFVKMKEDLQATLVSRNELIKEVTERKQAEATLRESEHRLHSLFDNMLNGFAYCKMIFDHERPQDFVYLEVNRAFGTLTGLKNVTGRRVSEVIPGILESDPELLETYGRVSLTGIPETFENYVEPLKMWFSITVYSPEEEYFVAVFDVITDRKHAEESLRDSNERFRSAFQYSTIGMALVSPAGKWIKVNSSMCTFIGYSEEDLLTKRFHDITYPDDLVIDLRRLRELEDGDIEFYTMEKRYVHKTGKILWGLLSVVPVRGSGGTPLYFLRQIQDITERKQAEDELRKSHDELELQVQQRTAALSQANMLLQTLLDNMPDQIYFKDTGSRFIKNSKAQALSLGLSDPSQVVGKTDFDFFPHAQESFTQEQEIIRSGKPLVDFEEWVVWPDGHGTWVSTSKVPLRDPEDKIIGTMGISRDITDRKRNEDELRKAINELEAFSYSVSHDLRAPLRGIDGWSLALLEDYGGQLDEQGQTYINRVRFEAQRMGSLIDDLLKLSHITRAEMHSERVDLSSIAKTIAARLQESQPERKVEFKIQKGLIAKGDEHLLEVALNNLLDNAFKFTSKRADALIEFGQMDNKSEHAFFVRDNGAGFDMAYAKNLFGAFQRMHKPSEFPGTGIGLATVQRIIHRHGGRVWAESTVNEGATFCFTLEEKI